LALALSWATLHFVEGWVEPTPGLVGFRCTQPIYNNLRIHHLLPQAQSKPRAMTPNIVFELFHFILQHHLKGSILGRQTYKQGCKRPPDVQSVWHPVNRFNIDRNINIIVA
jgi:hypothetical protein